MKRFDGPILFILATLMIDAIGIGIVFPIMPDLMARVGAGDTAEGSVWGGVLMAAYAGAQFLFGPLVGAVSDALGRRPVLIGALAVLTLDYVLMALAGSLWLLLLGRTLAGMAGATYITAHAYISDITPKEQRAARFGLIGAAFGLGFVMGPALGGLAASWHVTAPFWLAAGLAAANTAFGLVALPESLRPENRRPFSRRDIDPFGAIRAAFRVPGLGRPLAILFTFEFANMVYPVLWAFWVREVYGWSSFWIGMTLSAYGALAALVQGVAMPRVIGALGEARLMVWGMALAAATMVGFGFATSVWALCLLLPLAAATDLVPPTLTAMAANSVGEDRQGLVQGVISSLSAIAAALAPLGLTAVFGVFAAEDAALYLPGAPFLLGAALILAILPVAVRHRRIVSPGAT